MTNQESHDHLHTKYGVEKISRSIELSTLHEYFRNKIEYEGKGNEEIKAEKYVTELIQKHLPDAR